MQETTVVCMIAFKEVKTGQDNIEYGQWDGICWKTEWVHKPVRACAAETLKLDLHPERLKDKQDRVQPMTPGDFSRCPKGMPCHFREGYTMCPLIIPKMLVLSKKSFIFSCLN